MTEKLRLVQVTDIPNKYVIEFRNGHFLMLNGEPLIVDKEQGSILIKQIFDFYETLNEQYLNKDFDFNVMCEKYVNALYKNKLKEDAINDNTITKDKS